MADVLEAVTEVTGVDPLTMGRMPRTMRSRRLAICALREITGCSWPEIANEMGYAGHSSPMRVAAHGCDQDDWSELTAALA